jgi:hypothetical protein
VIVAVNRRRIANVEQLSVALRDARMPFAVEVEREGRRIFLVVQ